MLVQLYFALLALSTLAAAADPDCEELVKPLEDQTKVSGKWILYAGTSDNKEILTELKTINSSWIELSPIPDSDDMTIRWGDHAGGKCHHGAVNSTLSGNSTKVTFYFNSSTYECFGKYLVTCPDCILWTDNTVKEKPNGETRHGRSIYLFTKTGTLEDTHLEVFKKQAACLNFPPEFHFGGTELCPDAPDAKEEEQ